MDLNLQMANLVNFGIYGVPNVGTNLCGYSPETSDEELCARYFQTSVISPLAIFNNKETTLDYQPFNFTNRVKDSIVTSLTQRLSWMLYMRT